MQVASPTPSFVRRVITIIALVLVAVAIVALLFHAARVVLLAFAGTLFAVLLDGLTRLVQDKTGIKRSASLALVGITLLGVLIGLGLFLGLRVASQIDSIPGALSEGIEAVHGILQENAWAEPLAERLPDDKQEVSALASEATERLPTLASSALGFLGDLFVIVFLGIYLAATPRLYIDNAVRLATPRYRERLRTLAGDLGHALRRWLMGRFFSMALVGTLSAVGLYLLGIPLALALGLIAGLFSFVPFLGPIAATVPALLVAFLEGPTDVLAVLGLYVGIETLESYLITPLVQKRVVSLPPALLIAMQILMGTLLGVLGIAVATPLLVIVIVLVQALYLRDVLGDDVTLLGNS